MGLKGIRRCFSTMTVLHSLLRWVTFLQCAYGGPIKKCVSICLLIFPISWRASLLLQDPARIMGILQCFGVFLASHREARAKRSLINSFQIVACLKKPMTSQAILMKFSVGSRKGFLCD